MNFLRICFRYAVAIALFLSGAEAALAGGGGENMLLVVNPNDPASLQIANAYTALRDIPANNILFIAPPAGYSKNGAPISQTDVTNTYLTPISNAISARGLTNQINYIGAIGQAVSYSITPEADAGACNANSLDYALELLTPLTNGSGLTMNLASYSYDSNNPVSALYQDPSSIPIGDNPAVLHSSSSAVVYGGSTSATQYSIPTQYYMAGTIGYTGSNGNTASQVIASLQNAAASDGARPAGAIYFEDNSDIRSTARDQEWPATESQLTARGVSWVDEANTSGATPQNRANVSGAVCGAAVLTLPNGSTYLPGSWADDLTSYGCDFPDTSQTKATSFIAAGAAGSTGSVVEPYVPDTYPPPPPRFTNSSIYTFIADGSTLGEAFARAVPAPDTQMPLGDMLAQPYADVPNVSITSGPGNYGTAAGTISISATAALNDPKIATGIRNLELLVDGIVSGTSAGNNGTFVSNTAGLSDGIHEFRIVAINNSEAASEGYAPQQIVVNNHGRSINFAGGNLTLTSSAAIINLSVVTGSGMVAQVELACLGRVVAQASGGSLSLSPNVLAPGDNVIVPVALFTDGMQVAGGAFVACVETGTANAWCNGAGNGRWSNPSNWTSGSLPQNNDGIARFSGATVGGTVTLDSSATVEEVALDNSGGGGYTIAASPGQALTLYTADGAAAQCLINVLSGNHVISAPLILAAPGTLVNVTNHADSLTISGGVSGNGSLTLTGSGTVTLSGSNTYTGTTSVNCGTLTLGAGGGLVFQVTNSGINNIRGSAKVVLNGTFTIHTAAVTNSSGTWNLVPAGATYGGTFSVIGFTGNGAGTFTKTVGNQTWTFSTATGTLTLSTSQPVPAMPPWGALLLALLVASIMAHALRRPPAIAGSANLLIGIL